MSANLLGLDFGTQSVRCGIFDEKGSVLGVAEAKYDTKHPQKGWAEQCPTQWIDCMKQAIILSIKQLQKEQIDNIIGVSVCTTSSTVLCIGEDNKPLSEAILWMDNRAKEQVLRINRLNHPVLKYCGGETSVEWLVPKTLWLKENRPEIFNRSKRIVEMQDYITYVLTGRWCASVSQATCKGHFVLDEGGFNDDFFKSIGLDNYREIYSTDILEQGEIAGNLIADMAKEVGLPTDIPVYMGGIDAHVNMIGLGVVKPGDMGCVMGTSFVHLAASEKPVFADGVWGPYKSAIIPKQYCIEGGQVSAGSITKWFVNEFSIEGENPYMQIAEEAKNVSPGSEGVICLDFFQGNRTPYKDPFAKGMFYGLTLSNTRAHMYRAVLEAVAFGTRNIIETMEKSGADIAEIRGCGGVTNNEIWLKIIADVCKKPIIITKNSTVAGMLGAAMIVAVGSGVYKDFQQAADNMVQQVSVIKPDMNSDYEHYYERYLKIYDRLKDIMQEDEYKA